MLARGGMDVGQLRNLSQTTSRFWFIHDPNGIPMQTDPGMVLIKEAGANADQWESNQRQTEP